MEPQGFGHAPGLPAHRAAAAGVATACRHLQGGGRDLPRAGSDGLAVAEHVPPMGFLGK